MHISALILRLTFGRWLYHSCISVPTYEEWAQWYHREDLKNIECVPMEISLTVTYVIPSEECSLFGYCSRREYGHLVTMNIVLVFILERDRSTFELFAGKNQSLLIGWDSLFVLNFRFDIFDCVWRFDLIERFPLFNDIELQKHTSRVIVLPVRV